MMQIIEALLNPLLELIAPKTPPGSSLFIIMIATMSVIFSTLVSRKFIDMKKLSLYTKKTKEFQKLQRKALRSQDPILKKKVENQKATSQKMQSELMKMRFKPLLLTMIPLIIVFFSLSSYYNHTSHPDSLVGNIPFDLPEMVLFFEFGVNCDLQRKIIVDQNLSTDQLTGNQKICLKNPNLHYMPTYIGWYIAVNVIINGLVSKVAGLTPE